VPAAGPRWCAPRAPAGGEGRGPRAVSAAGGRAAGSLRAGGGRAGGEDRGALRGGEGDASRSLPVEGTPGLLTLVRVARAARSVLDIGSRRAVTDLWPSGRFER